MGQVYRAYDARLARRVALKILRARTGEEGGGQHGDRVSLILREARAAAAALDHPNAVSIFECGEHEGVPYIVMELVSGRTLREAVGRRLRAPRHPRRLARGRRPRARRGAQARASSTATSSPRT